MKKIAVLSFGFILALGAAVASHGQSVLASGTISGTPDANVSGEYDYTLTLSALSGSVPINSFWFAWTPGNDYLGSVPTSITGGNGWTGSASGPSIQFFAGTPLTAGNSETFHFINTDTPTQMGNEVGPLHSVVYSGGLFSSPSQTIGVQAVPEPSVISLLVMGGATFGGSLIRNRRSKT